MYLVRRLAAVLMAVAMAGSACSSDKDSADEAVPTTGSSETTAAPLSTETTAPNCSGIGDVPKAGAITWIANGRVHDESGCLVAVGGSTLAWGGKGDRLLVDGTVVVKGKDPVKVFDGAGVLSRPSGTAVLRIDEQKRLFKREVDAKDARNIGFIDQVDTAVYHPAGRHIVVGGFNGQKPELQMSDNEGRNPLALLEIEAAKSVGSPAFTASGALLYTADHGDRVDLHRLEIDDSKLTTVDSVPAPGTIDHVVTSPFEGGGVAWTKGECAKAVLRAQRGGTYFKLEGTPIESARPVGWMPDGTLVALAGPRCEKPGATTGTLYAFKDGSVRKVAEGVTAAAVRAELPPPPAPPKNIPQEAPA